MAGILSRFASNRKGNFGMMLAFAMPVLIGSVAIGVDVSSVLGAKTELQDANDAAVLFAARYFKEKRTQPALSLIQKNLDANSTMTITANKLSFNASRSEFSLESTAKVKTYLMGYFGQGMTNHEALSKANLGFAETLEFVLSLDTTTSMAADGKIDGLKLAANNFLDAMFDAKDRGADIKGAIVPFAQYVNVGVSMRGQSWLNVPADIDNRVTTRECKMVAPVTGQTNCRTEIKAAYTIEHPAQAESCVTMDRTRFCTPAKAAWTQNVDASSATVCDDIYGAAKEVCSDVTTGELITWQGMVGSRAYPLNVRDASYGNRIPGLLNVNGSAEIQRLTSDRALLINKVNSLTPSGETYLPEGIIWGTRVLTKQAPFTEARSTGRGGRPIRRVLVLMTDGENSLSPDGAYHTKDDRALADTYTAEACDEAKAKDLEVFTISFGTAVPADAQALLAACASESENFYHARSSADLKSAFDNIASQMLNIRLSQ